jgi:hypothetical protein
MGSSLKDFDTAPQSQRTRVRGMDEHRSVVAAMGQSVAYWAPDAKTG